MICFNPSFIFGAYSHRQPPQSRWMRRFALLTRTNTRASGHPFASESRAPAPVS